MAETQSGEGNHREFHILLKIFRERGFPRQQKKLARILGYLSEEHGYKTISKWENNKGIPPDEVYPKLRAALLAAGAATEEELQELGRAYEAVTGTKLPTLSAAESLPGLIEPRLKPDTPFLQELLAVLDWEENRRTFAKLFGSVVASIKMLELVTQKEYGELTPNEWGFPALLHTLRDVIERRGYINFMHAEDLATWTLGFFRNDVYRRLIIVLEACIFDWHRQHNMPQDTAALRHTPLVAKLQQLETQADVSKHAKRMIAELIASITEYQEGEKSIEGYVASVLTDPRNFPKNLQFSELSSRVASHLSDAECVAIAYTFDTDAPYAEEPYSISYNKYFAITVHALRWVVEFQRQLFPG
jgi:hypothetical protein